MGFAGELSTIGLSEVFQNVAFNRLTGVLTVRERGREASVYMEDGTIRAFRGERPLDYMTLAESSAAASPHAVRAAAKRKRRRRSFRDVLRTIEGFDESSFDQAIASSVTEELILLFGWKYASFVFEETRPEDGAFEADQLSANIRVDPTAVAMEAARRVDEWEMISHEVQSERDIFLPIAELALDAASPDVHEILARLDGTHDLAAVVDELPYGRFHVLRTVADLSERGIVARATCDQLIALAHTAEEGGDAHRAVRHLEASLEMDRGNLEARRELVRLYERSGRRNDAAKQIKRLGQTQEQSGDLDGALESYQRAADLAPYETEALDRIVNIHDSRGDKGAFMRAGLCLAEALASNGLHEESLDVYNRLLAQDDDSVVLREALATAYIKLHEPKKAGRELLTLARRAWDRDDSPRALHYYRSVLAVDRSCDEAQDRIHEIQEARRHRRKRTRNRRLAMAGITALVCAVLWQAAREWSAHLALHEAARASLGAVGLDSADATLAYAITHYARVCESYPMTRGAAEAEETVHTLLLDELHRIRVILAEDPVAAERAVRRLARVRLPENIEALWVDARDRTLARINETKEK